MASLVPRRDLYMGPVVPSHSTAGSSIPRNAISAQGPQVRFALRYGLVHALTRAAIRNAAPGLARPAACAPTAALLACDVIRPEFRMRFAPLFMTAAILVEQHPKANAGPPIAALAKPLQSHALCRRAVLRQSGRATKHSSAGNNYRRTDKCRIDLHNSSPQA
jgi:hypothetical protein